ncbi:tail fiber domain-containing protein [Burkholderia cepacia]|uniref:tail fiber domain-containing protein n=1 Tax=Burkholderia cepacia TaxID=292 RepID=UPI001CF3F8F1|nr:tail fiber domain-containing protein [Burkholderia cepacia]MCA8026411.1 tail fiber domain-containing protein [Burkholderia cepacia]
MRHYWLTSDAPDLPARAFKKALGRNRPETLEGGGKGGDAPTPPDPYAIANATTQTNEATAAYNKSLNLNNYTNPFGSQNTVQTGTGADGAPIYTTYNTANPQLQGALTGLLGQAGNASGINSSALNGLMGLNGQYQNLNNSILGLAGSLNPGSAQNAQQAGTNAAYQSAMGYLQPQFNQQQQSLNAQLANQGLSVGSQAYTNATGNLALQQGQQQQQAINNAQLTGSQIGTQNWQNQLAGLSAQAGLYGMAGSNLGQQGALYGQQAGLGQLPFSELGSLAALVPGYSGVGSSSAAAPDMQSLFNNQYQGQLAQYNAGVQSSNATMGGLFGLGAAGAMAFLSDRRAKRDIRRIGTWHNGLPVYTYRYVGSAARHIGFMADEVKKVVPAAVIRGADGLDRVNYCLAGG